MTPETAALKAAVMVGCAWELAALSSGRIPTLSALMWRVPMRPRAALWAAVAVVATDHFLTRRWT